jgi:hypothetical protein
MEKSMRQTLHERLDVLNNQLRVIRGSVQSHARSLCWQGESGELQNSMPSPIDTESVHYKLDEIFNITSDIELGLKWIEQHLGVDTGTVKASGVITQGGYPRKAMN